MFSSTLIAALAGPGRISFPGRSVIPPANQRVISLSRRATPMAIERIMQYECKVCGRKIDVTRTGDVYEEPVYCCGVQSVETGAPAMVPAPAAEKKPAARKPARKKVAKKARKKLAKKAAKKAKKKV